VPLGNQAIKSVIQQLSEELFGMKTPVHVNAPKDGKVPPNLKDMFLELSTIRVKFDHIKLAPQL